MSSLTPSISSAKSSSTQRKIPVPPHPGEGRVWAEILFRHEPDPRVDAPATPTWDEVGKLPKTALTADMHCVTTWSRLDNNWEGVAFKELVALVKPRGNATYVIAHCDADYTTSLPIDVLA